MMLASTVLALLTGSPFVLASSSISVSFAGDEFIHNADDFKIVAKVTNTGDETLTLLNDPNTLLTPNWPTKMFHLSNAQGLIPEFKGVVVKWSAASAVKSKTCTVMKPGETLKFEHALGRVYNFTSAGVNTYHILPTNDAILFTQLTPVGEIKSIRADVVGSHSATLSGSLSPTAYASDTAKSASLIKRVHSFNGCTSSQQAILNTAAVNAQTLAEAADSYLVGLSGSTLRWKIWFGTYTATHRTIVLSHFSSLQNGQLTTDSFDCTCTDADIYAYGYPDTYGYIYLCGSFWTAPATGPNSMAGLLIGVSLEFTRNGGLQDSFQGEAAAKAIAVSNTAAAISNIANYEYFAENDPPLS